MDYNQIDVLDKSIVWQGGAPDAAIDSPPFAGPLLVVCMDRGGISAGNALARIKARRPIAGPNPGFLAQLQRLWPQADRERTGSGPATGTRGRGGSPSTGQRETAASADAP